MKPTPEQLARARAEAELVKDKVLHPEKYKRKPAQPKPYKAPTGLKRGENLKEPSR